MKTSQWILAIVVLAGMVFAITFGMNFIGNRGGSTTAPVKEGLRLSFPNPRYPYNGLPAVICEYNRPGSCDFWFSNPNDKEVRVGLYQKTCKCSSIHLYVSPIETAVALDVARLGCANLLPPGGGVVGYMAPVLTGLALAQWRDDWADEQLKTQGSGLELTGENEAVVPAGAIGAIHLVWKTEKPDPNRSLKLHLWTDYRTNSVLTLLDAETTILMPMQGFPELELGKFTERDLPKSGINVFCFSQTRDSMPISAAIVREGRSEARDTIAIGKIERLSDAECAKLERAWREKEWTGAPLRCAYKVPVTLLAVSPDKTMPFELGVFRRSIEFRCADGTGIDPMQTALIGQVQGPVQVGDQIDGGHINLGTFYTADGSRKHILLQSDLSGLELEVDTSRIPAFLEKPVLELPDVSPSGHRTWRLTVESAPGKAVGRFPNPLEPVFRDSAIYIKTKDDSPRTIRIPVTGMANLAPVAAR
jgi:hypothetical protein